MNRNGYTDPFPNALTTPPTSSAQTARGKRGSSPRRQVTTDNVLNVTPLLAGFQRGVGDGSGPATSPASSGASDAAGEEPSGLADGAAQWEGAPRGSSATYGSSSAILSTTT